MIWTVTLNPALDQTDGVDGSRTDPGGKGLNVSKTLLACGIASLAAGFAAGARGQELIRRAEAAGLTLRMVSAPGETRVNRKIFDGASVTERNEPGPAFDPESFARLRTLLRQSLQPGDALALCGSVPPGSPTEVYRMLAEDAAGCRVVVDGSGAALTAALAARPDAVKPNLAELEQWAGHPLPDMAARADAMQALLAQGARRVLLSLGAAGAMLATAEGVWQADAPTVPVRGTVGAGDAMTAMLCHLPLEDAPALLRDCVAAGSAAVMQPGSAPLRYADWQRLRAQVTVRRL